MRTILVLMDTLRKDFLKAYNADTIVLTPHLDAFAKEAVTFDNHYIGSTPCMPARRDIMTGRLNFLERSWGPIEPFDITLTKVLQSKDVFSHLTTDHCHYFRTGGEGYINQFTTWDYHRGQEGDPWVSKIRDPEWMPEQYYGKLRRQYQANREVWKNQEELYPTPQTFQAACQWLEDNQGEENFFLQVEVFDPHEPFDVPEQYLALYEDDYHGPFFETPLYGEVAVPDPALKHIRKRYTALVTMTDKYFGQLIQTLKDLKMYEDTLIIVTSDHGYFLGERNLFGKNYMHNFNELAAIPLFVKDPYNRKRGERVAAVTQNIDIMPTVLDYYHLPIPAEVRGESWVPLLNDTDYRKEFALYGAHGITVNITDGHYTYFRAPNLENKPLYEYAAIPTTIRHYLGEQNPEALEMGRYLERTDYPVYKVPIERAAILDGLPDTSEFVKESLLFNVEEDPKQQHPIQDPAIEDHYKKALAKEMAYHEAPEEQYDRLDLH